MTTTSTPGSDSTAAHGAGRARQNQIYRAGVFGHLPNVPTDAAELARRGRKAMTRSARAYVDGGGGEGVTMTANRAAFDRWRIVPRVLHSQAHRDLSTTVLGTTLPGPVLLAPLGALGVVSDDSDLLVARGASAGQTPYVFSAQGCSPMEDTAVAMGGTPFWYQLYWATDEALVDSLIHRAEQAGATALVVTVDLTMLGWRPQDLNLGSLPFARGIGIAQYTSDPRFQELVRQRMSAGSPDGARPRVTPAAVRSLVSIAKAYPGELRDNLRSPEPRASVETFLGVYSNPGLSWDHLATLRGRTRLPIVVKGILHPDDARRAFDLGVDGIVVSNHGGRQLDRSVAALDALVAVREAVGPERVVLMDSGIRTGTDLFVALALGADACLLGRPYVYGLAIDGADGVAAVVANVIAELDLTMAQVGATSVADITRDHLVHVT